MQADPSSKETTLPALSKETTPSDLRDDTSSIHSRDLEKAESQAQYAAQNHDRQKDEKILETWDGPDDPQNPVNWPLRRKYTTTVLYSTMTFCLTFASSVFSTATIETSKLFNVSTEVMTLGTSLFVIVSSLNRMIIIHALTDIE